MNDVVHGGGSIQRRLDGKTRATVLCWIFGMGSLLAWNSMLTISDYYYQLFPEYHPARVLTLVYQPFAVGTTAILAYYEAKVNTRKRNLAGFCIYFLSTLGLIVLDVCTNGKGGLVNYIGVCFLVGCFGLADAHCQGGMVGDLSFMCPEFVQSYFGGLAASGALTSGLRLITKALFDNTRDGNRKGVILFLSIATFFEFVCICLYAYTFPKIVIVKHFRSKAAAEGSTTVSSDLAAAGIMTKEVAAKQSGRISTRELFWQNKDYAFDLYITYALTLSIFPGFLYENTGKHQLGEWYALVLIAMYNVWDLLGRYAPLWKRIKLESRNGLVVACLSRFLLIPAFFFTAKYGDQGYMIFLVSFLGLTNGYLTVCAITTAPKGYKGPEQNALGNILVLCLLSGIFSGVCLDWLWAI